ARPPVPSGGRFPSVRLRSSPSGFRRFVRSPGLHPFARAGAPLARTLAPDPFETHDRRALLSVRPFASRALPASGGSVGLVRPLLTARTVLRRRPFRRKARSPQVRSRAVPHTAAGFMRFPLVARASRSKARSPWSATPPIRFLFVGSWFGSPLPSAVLAD